MHLDRTKNQSYNGRWLFVLFNMREYMELATMSGYVNTANLQPLRVLTHTLTSYNKVMVTDAIANRAYFHLKAETRCKIPLT